MPLQSQELVDPRKDLLKEVLLRMHDARPRVLRLDKEGEGAVTAGQVVEADLGRWYALWGLPV